MSVNKNDKSHFQFNVDLDKELTEETITFNNQRIKKDDIVFYACAICVAILIPALFYFFGSISNRNESDINRIIEYLEKTDKAYVREEATNAALLSEKEDLTQNALKKQEELSEFKNYSENKDALTKKLEASKAEYEKLNSEYNEKKQKNEAGKENSYSLTLTPGIYVVGKNIPAAVFEVTGSGSIISASNEKETKINEKLSSDTPITVQLFDGYTVKLNSKTTFLIKD